jgi:hypothetical protein
MSHKENQFIGALRSELKSRSLKSIKRYCERERESVCVCVSKCIFTHGSRIRSFIFSRLINTKKILAVMGISPGPLDLGPKHSEGKICVLKKRAIIKA